MAQYAPEHPTTQQLEAAYPLSTAAEVDITLARDRVSSLLRQQEPGLVAVIGPCALHEADLATITTEGQEMRDITARTENRGLSIVQRKPVWKPRTSPESWWGEETTPAGGAERAYAALVDHANDGVAAAIEIGHYPHASRYGKLLTLGWFGGRNIDNLDLMRQTAALSPKLPLAVKNGLDGTIDNALRHIQALGELRGEDSGAVTLLYRGGDNAKDPASWERQYRTALEKTNGRLIVDTAHGSEMAHDPAGAFQKSEIGQITALQHVLAIAGKGEVPVGIMMEASDTPRRVDPPMPLRIALDGVMALYKIRTEMPTHAG